MKQKEGVKSRRSSALKSDKLGLNCNANKGSAAGTGDLGVPTTYETLIEMVSIGVGDSTHTA